MLGNEDKRVRDSATNAIGRLGAMIATPEFLEGLLLLLRDNNKGVRDSAANAVGKFGVAAATLEIEWRKEWLPLLKDKEWSAHRATAEAIDKHSASEILWILRQRLSDEDILVRWSAIKAMSKLGAEAATPEILKELLSLLKGDKGRGAQWSVAKIISALRELVATPEFLSGLLLLLRNMRDKDEYVRQDVVNVMGVLVVKLSQS